MIAIGKRHWDEIYQQPTPQTEFYSMEDLQTPPVLYNPTVEEEDEGHFLANYHTFNVDSPASSQGSSSWATSNQQVR